jgi:hypothetical protein
MGIALLINESINNFSQWKNIVNEGLIGNDDQKLVDRYGFNPM